MRRAVIVGCCCLLSAWLAGAAGAQISPAPTVPDFYPDFSSCEDLKAQCKDASAEDIYYAALLEPSGRPPLRVGLCYVHDKTGCPNCRCNDYIKQTWRSDAKGADGGTGCVGWPTPPADPALSRALAAAKLKEMCESGSCCCPQVEHKPCKPDTPVRRCGDSISGACCTFPNACSAPGPAEGWH